MTRATDRRAVLGGILVASAAATIALPATVAVGMPALSAVDRRVVELWRRLAKVKAISRELSAHAVRAKDEWERIFNRSDEAGSAMAAVEDEIADHMEASVLALAAIILVEIQNADDRGARIYKISLAAIRPQLVGAIAEAADRVLAAPQAEEVA
jgi:hypothetical protein